MILSRSRQSGATLVVGLVMLVVLTLLVISAIRAGNINLRIAGNSQVHEEVAAAAQQATEQVISTNFTANPVAQTIPVTIGNSNYTVTVPAQACTASLPLTNASLDPTNPADAPCISSSTAQNTGLMVQGAVTPAAGQSWCYAQQWDVEARVTDNNSGATAVTHQGVALRVPAGTACP
ncbi:MAG TPA: PilX N-terminal domain-containing pilus assembly protein [Rhodocyclaceae bacterium]